MRGIVVSGKTKAFEKGKIITNELSLSVTLDICGISQVSMEGMAMHSAVVSVLQLQIRNTEAAAQFTQHVPILNVS